MFCLCDWGQIFYSLYFFYRLLRNKDKRPRPETRIILPHFAHFFCAQIPPCTSPNECALAGAHTRIFRANLAKYPDEFFPTIYAPPLWPFVSDPVSPVLPSLLLYSNTCCTLCMNIEQCRGAVPENLLWCLTLQLVLFRFGRGVTSSNL